MFSEEGRRVAEKTKSYLYCTGYVCSICFCTAAQPHINTQTSLFCRELDNVSGGDRAGNEPMSGHTALGLDLGRFSELQGVASALLGTATSKLLETVSHPP